MELDFFNNDSKWKIYCAGNVTIPEHFKVNLKSKYEQRPFDSWDGNSIRSLIFIEKSDLKTYKAIRKKSPLVPILSFDKLTEDMKDDIFECPLEWVEFEAILTLFEETDLLTISKVVDDSIVSELEKNQKRFIGISDEIFGNESFEKVLSKYKDHNTSLIHFKNIDFLENEVTHFIESTSFMKVSAGVKLNDINYDEIKNPNFIFLPYSVKGENLYFKIIDFDSSDINLSIIILANMLIEKGRDVLGTLRSEKDILEQWEEPFNTFAFPVALLTAKGELLSYNLAFSKSGIMPADCLSLSNGSTFEKNSLIYKVEIIHGDNDRYLYLFLSEDIEREQNSESNRGASNEELGIISSSIAHELNNPLAGILAAICLLELEDWDDEALESLKNIKEGATRCKNLVEIFLGFSRYRSENIPKGAIHQSIYQALELLRFRMIENNIKLDVDFVGEGRFETPINPSMVSMLYYLVFGEVLTHFGHYRLVSEKELSDTLTLRIQEYDRRIEIGLDYEIRVEEALKASKLIEYILEQEGLNLEFNDNKLIFSNWKLL